MTNSISNETTPEEDQASPDSETGSPTAAQQLPDTTRRETDQGKPLAPSLVDELGIEDLTDVLFGVRGKIFSAAGRNSPVAEFDSSGVLLRPAQKPYMEEPPGEVIVYTIDEKGILLNELGEKRKIIGAKYKGQDIYTLGETKPGTVKHYAAWFDQNGVARKFYVQNEALTVDMIYRIRNRTHDGEISAFPEIRSE